MVGACGGRQHREEAWESDFQFELRLHFLRLGMRNLVIRVLPVELGWAGMQSTAEDRAGGDGVPARRTLRRRLRGISRLVRRGHAVAEAALADDVARFPRATAEFAPVLRNGAPCYEGVRERQRPDEAAGQAARAVGLEPGESGAGCECDEVGGAKAEYRQDAPNVRRSKALSGSRLSRRTAWAGADQCCTVLYDNWRRAMHFRLATYNVENLFGRAKVLNFAKHETGDEKMVKIAELQSILEQDTYSRADRDRAGRLYKELFSFIGYNMLRSKNGFYLFRRHDADGDGKKETYRLAPKRRDQWQGFLTYKRDTFSDETSRHTARVIKEVDADVLCINEVESRLVLDYFNADRLDRRYPYNILIDGKTDPRGIDVGIYSKHPIGTVRTNIFATDEEGTAIFSRDCLEVEIVTDRGSVHLLANHLKSKYRGGDGRRKAQAQKVRHILEERYDLKTQRIAVLGDLNDTPNSDPLSPLTGMAGLSDVLASSVGPPADCRWTYRFENEFNQIDYILVSKPLAVAMTGAGVERRGMPPETLDGSNAGVRPFRGITSWRDAGSDHAAVFADFNLS